MRDIASMAREAGMVYREFEDEFANANTDGVDLETLKTFEALVRADERERVMNEPLTKAQWQRFEDEIRADEREACAKVAETYREWDDTGMGISKAIRARGNT
jgi:hypothetical protein